MIQAQALKKILSPHAHDPYNGRDCLDEVFDNLDLKEFPDNQRALVDDLPEDLDEEDHCEREDEIFFLEKDELSDP